MVKNLTERSRETYSKLSGDAKSLIVSLKADFQDYFQGRILIPHEDFLYKVRDRCIEAEQESLILEYSSLVSANSALPRVIGEFVANYETHKYGDIYLLNNFLLLWDQKAKDFVSGDEDLGSYSPLITGLVNNLERLRELENYLYTDETDAFIPSSEEFKKLGLISLLSNNKDLIQETFLTSLEELLEVSVRDICTDKILANEAAIAFISAYGENKRNAQYKKGLGHFLLKYELATGTYVRGNNLGNYANLYHRLNRSHGNLWRQRLVEMVDEPTKSRLEFLNRDLGKKGVIEEDKIRLIEKLAEGDLFKYLHMLSEEGPDTADILIAARIGSLTPEEKKVLVEITKRRDVSLGDYLGICRIAFPDDAVKYDAKRCLGDLCYALEYDALKDEILSSVLFHKMRVQYLQEFANDPEVTLAELEKELDGEKNEVRRVLLERTLAHFSLRKEVKKVKGVKNEIVVIG